MTYDIIPESQFIKQSEILLNIIIPELSHSVIINIFTIEFLNESHEYDSIKITQSCAFLEKTISTKNVISLIKEHFDIKHPEFFSYILAKYLNSLDNLSCSLCFIFSESKTVFKYANVLYKLDNFEKEVENVYFDAIGKEKNYIFIETLLSNILNFSQRHISNIEYPQIARDIATHSADYVLCRNLTLPHQDIFILLSSLYYEGNPAQAKIVLVSPFLKYNNVLKLVNPILLCNKNVRTIRKLLELSCKGYVLALNNNWEIVEITKQEYIKDIPYLSIEFLGHMHWQLCMSEKTIFRYQNGSYYISNGYKSKRYYQQMLSSFFNKLDYRKTDVLSTVIELAAMQKHGTSILVTDEAEDETKRLCLLNRGIEIEELDLSKNVDIIMALTAIDGSILLDFDCKCYGAGLILDGEAICVGDPARGARYNSVINYIEIKKKMGKKYMAFIISEDGMINVVY